MKATIFSLLSIFGMSAGAVTGGNIVGTAVPVVQQTIEITLTKTLCPSTYQGGSTSHYYAFCAIPSYSLGLPEGGHIISGIDSETYGVSIDNRYIYVETRDHSVDYATIQALILTAQAKVKVIYQGPQLK